MKILRPLAAPALLPILFALACGDSKKEPAEDEDSLEPLWSYEAPGVARGVAVRQNGEVVVTVALDESPFEEAGGGVVVFDSAGEILETLPMPVPAKCPPPCSTQRFYPNQPLLLADGSIVVGDYTQNTFHLKPDNSFSYLPWSDPEWLAPLLAGVDRRSAPGPDGESALLVGYTVTVLGLDGVVRQKLDFGAQVRQVVHFEGSLYLLSLRETLGAASYIGRWDASTGELDLEEMPSPVEALAVRDGWTAAVLATDEPGTYALLRFGPSAAESEPVIFDLPFGAVDLAIRPGHLQVVVGSEGPAWGDEKRKPEVNVGGAVAIDLESGDWVELDHSSVKGLAFSPDGGMLYIADTGGLHAYELD